MREYCKRRTRVAVTLFVCVASCFAQSQSGHSITKSNRRTSVRFLKLAEKYCEAGDYATASLTADMGISYCDEVADLWYIKAKAAKEEGRTRAEVLPLVEKSLFNGSWVDYNRDVARVLYAQVLCDTGRGNEALSILDEEPYIHSADAEFVRAASYYRDGDTQAARGKIDDSRKMYPEDTRFPLLFFRYERTRGVPLDEDAQRIADAFVARIDSYKDCSAELFLLAAMSSNKEQKRRMLQSFSACEMRHPLYAEAAMREGLLSAQDAVEYFFDFADQQISYDDAASFLKALSDIDDEGVKASVKAHLDAYEGLLTIDTTRDGEPNLFVKYSRGRPQTVNCDANSDGRNEWVARCDFGLPTSLEVGGKGKRLKTEIVYGVYPAISSVTLVTGKVVVFSLVEEKYLWSPFEMKCIDEWKTWFGSEVFVPQEASQAPALDIDSLVNAAWRSSMPIDEREDANVTYTMLNGLRQTAEYTSHGKVYARGAYSDGLPVLREIDNDGDGVFETIERYTRVKNKESAQEGSDEMPFATDDVYVSKVEVDVDGDTVPDFVEEYTEDGGKITTWDEDADGQWDVRYERRTLEDNTVEEKAYFFAPPKRDAVCVESVAGVPIEVSVGTASSKVTRGITEGMYCIGEVLTAGDEAAVSEKLNNAGQGVSILTEHDGKRLFAVRIGEMSYATIIHDDVHDENE